MFLQKNATLLKNLNVCKNIYQKYNYFAILNFTNITFTNKFWNCYDIITNLLSIILRKYAAAPSCDNYITIIKSKIDENKFNSKSYFPSENKGRNKIYFQKNRFGVNRHLTKHVISNYESVLTNYGNGQ